MTWLRVVAARLRGLLLRGRLDAELDEELRAHLEMLREEFVRKGMSPEEAHYAARRSFGGIEQAKEAYRDARGPSSGSSCRTCAMPGGCCARAPASPRSR